MPKRFLGPLCVFVLCVILALGLWPFHTPANRADWLKGKHGLWFDGEGSLISEPLFPVGGPSYSIEIWASAEDLRGEATLLTFFNPESGNCPQMSLVRNWGDLKIETRQEKSYFDVRKRFLLVDDLFQPGQFVFLAVTSGGSGTRVYANGQLQRTAERFRVLDCPFQGRLILGDASGRSDGWFGDIRGLATYQKELGEDQIRRHFETWAQAGAPVLEVHDGNQSLYLLDEGKGRVAHDRTNALNLEMPERYTVVDKKILAWFADGFSLTPGYWQDLANNIIGFVPVGFVFFAYLVNTTSVKRPALLASLLGIALSVTIECTQPFLATRESDITDLLTNTLGTLAGVAFYAEASRWWQKHHGHGLIV